MTTFVTTRDDLARRAPCTLAKGPTMRTLSSIAFVSLSLLSLVACKGGSSDAANAAAAIEAEELTQVATPVVATLDRVEAPPGEFNLFSVYASYETASCGLSENVYGIVGPSGVRIEDCPECLLPAAIELGDPPAGFDAFVCREGTQGCAIDEDTSGVTLRDLTYATPLCGEYVTPTSFSIVFQHLNTTAPEEPRVFITARAELTLDADGVLHPQGDWVRCIETIEGESCTGEDGSYSAL